jgi:NADH:ubiquinone reductase (H+-translocating)
MSNVQKQILILGAGFGGVYAALEFEKHLARDPSVKVTLINRENFFLFTPMLHEVAASDLDITNIVSSLRKLLRHVDFFEGDVHSIDLDKREVTFQHGMSEHKHTLIYDHLIIALGGITNFYGLPGLEENALTMKSLGDAITLRNRLIENLEIADYHCTHEDAACLTLVVAGGGYAGVETIAAVNDFLREAVAFYPHLKEEMLRVVLVHDLPHILPELGEDLAVYTEKKLAERGIEVRLGVKVTGYQDSTVQLADGTEIMTNTLVWTAGVAANPLLKMLPCKKERGRVVVNEYLEVDGYPGVWAVGDCAMVPDLKSGKLCPPTAQYALRQGVTVARNITASIKGEKSKKFEHTNQGQLAAIGRRTAVASIAGINFSGFFAWVLWRSIYLMKLPRFEKKVRVALDWTLDIFYSKDLVQFLTTRERCISVSEDNLAVKANHP